MANGFIEKYKANAARLNDEGLKQLAEDMEKGGYDATDEQWEDLNAAVDALPVEDEQARSDAISGQGRGDSKGPKIPGADGDDAPRYVSGDEAGTGSNPIGYPGTQQDQDAPGQRPKTVPGQKPLKKPGE